MAEVPFRLTEVPSGTMDRAGLPGRGRSVWVGPPLFERDPSRLPKPAPALSLSVLAGVAEKQLASEPTL